MSLQVLVGVSTEGLNAQLVSRLTISDDMLFLWPCVASRQIFLLVLYKVFSHFSEWICSSEDQIQYLVVGKCWEHGCQVLYLGPKRLCFYSVVVGFVICAGLSRQQEIREGGFCLSSTFMWIIEAVNKTPHFHCVKLKSAIECSRTEPSILHVHVGWVVSSFWTVVIWKKKWTLIT